MSEVQVQQVQQVQQGDDEWVVVEEDSEEPCALWQGLRAIGVSCGAAAVGASKGAHAGVTTEMAYEAEISKVANAFGVFVGTAVRLVAVMGTGVVSGVAAGLSAGPPSKAP
jgi:hypothetical protein